MKQPPNVVTLHRVWVLFGDNCQQLTKAKSTMGHWSPGQHSSSSRFMLLVYHNQFSSRLQIFSDGN